MRMGKNVKIEFSAGAALLLGALYFVLDWDGLGALLLAAAAHEAGHFAALRLTGGRVSGVRAEDVYKRQPGKADGVLLPV